jgi:hypothetical protein
MRPDTTALSTITGRITALFGVITTTIGRIVEIPFRIIIVILRRIHENLVAHPGRYQNASRLLAGGICATIGIFIAVTIVGNIVLLQNLKMLAPTPEWSLFEAGALTAFLGLVGFLVGFGLFKMQPGLVRGLLAGLCAFAFTASVVMVLRFGLGYQPWLGGTMAMLTAFPIAFGAAWGMGGWAKQNMTIEANMEARAHPVTPKPNLGAFDGVKFNEAIFKWLGNRLWPVLKPLVGPAVIVTALVGAFVAVLLVVGQIAPGKRVQTYLDEAATTTVGGTVDFLGLQLPKFVVFLIVAALLLGAVATTGLILALIFNALGSAVKSAKTAAKQPLDLSEKGGRSDAISKAFQWVMRLVQFNIDFVVDIVNAIGGMFGIRAAK